MAFTERIKVLLDIESTKGVTALKTLRTNVAEAEGAFGKFKAGAKGALDLAKQYSAQLAVAGGAALVTFGVKAVHAFEDTAKAAIDLGTATGLTTEQASRWIGVADDMEVSAGDLASALTKVLKGLDGAVWKKYGIDTRDAQGNIRPTNELLLDAFDALSKIPDGAARAKAGNDLFGKSYKELAPLVGKSRSEYEKMLSTVEKGQVITKAEAEKAERMRLAEDQLSDAIKEVTLAVGQAVAGLAPYVTKLAEIVALVDKLPDGWVDQLVGPPGAINHQENELSNYVEALYAAAAASGDFTGYLLKQGYSQAFAERALREYNTMLAEANDTGETATEVNRDHATSLDDTAAAASETDRETRRLNNSTDEAWRASRKWADELGKTKDRLKELQDQELSAIDKQFAYNDAIDAATDAAKDYHDSLKDGKATEEDRSDALAQAGKSAYDAAKAFAELQQANGNVSSSTDLMILSLQQQADQLGPNDPLRANILALIGQLKQIPQAVPPPLKITLDAQIMADTKKKLGDLIALIKSVGTAGSSLVIGQPKGKTSGKGFAAGGGGTRGFGGSLGDLLGSGQAGVWEAPAAVADAAGQIDTTEVDLARRRWKRGEITLQQYKDIVDQQLALSDEKYGKDSAQSEDLFDLQSSLADQLAANVAAAEKAKQDAIDKTTKAWQDQLAAMLAVDNANADLAEAVQNQAQAQADYNAALDAYNKASAPGSKKTAEERAALLEAVAAAQEKLDKATIAGAKARAATKGAPGSAEYESSIAADLAQYIASHGDPRGALALELSRHNLSNLPPPPGGTGFSDAQVAALASAVRQAVIDGMAQAPAQTFGIQGITTLQTNARKAAT